MSNKNIKSENVTKSSVSEEDVDTIQQFSKLDISAKSIQSSSCDPSSADQLLKKRKSLKSGPSVSSPDSHSHSLADTHSPGITQHTNMDQAGK